MPTVNDLLALPSLQGGVVVAGGRGLGRQVENLSVMEVPDIEDYIKQGDFLLTTLFPVYREQSKLKDLIPRLNAAGLCGVGIKLNRYVDEVPTYFLAQADECAFPLVVLPADSNFSELINAFLKNTLERKSLELEYRDRIHKQLFEIIVKGQEHDALARDLSRLLQRSVTLLSAGFETLAECRVRTGKPLDTAPLRERAGSCTGRSFLPVFWNGRHGYLSPVHYGAERAGYILVSAAAEFELSPLERMTVEQFSIVFRIIVQRQRTVAEMERQYVTEFICDLLYGKIDDASTALNRARAFGWDLTFPQSVCLIDVESSRRASDRVELTGRLERCLSGHYTGGKRWKTFCANTGRYVVLLLDETAAQDYERVFEAVAGLFEALGITRYHASLSRPAHALDEVPRAYRDARRTMEVAWLVGEKKLLHFKETGVYRMIQSNENKEELLEFCMDTLEPVLRHDREHNTDLLNTLEAILRHGGNLKETAESMFVHYNTIRYRNKLLTQLLGQEGGTFGPYQDISLALKIYRTLHQGQKKTR